MVLSKALYQQNLHPPHTDDTFNTKTTIFATLIGNQISKRFYDSIYPSAIAVACIGDEHIQHWCMKYGDDDGEDLTLQELCDGLDLYKLHLMELIFAGITPTLKSLKIHQGPPHTVIRATIWTSTSPDKLDVTNNREVNHNR